MFIKLFFFIFYTFFIVCDSLAETENTGFFKLAREYELKGDIDLAQEYYKKACEYSEPKACLKMGNFLFEKIKKLELELNYEKETHSFSSDPLSITTGTSNMPKNSGYYHNLKNLQKEIMQNNELALSYYLQACNQIPETNSFKIYPESCFNVARCYGYKKDYKNAKISYQKFCKLEPGICKLIPFNKFIKSFKSS